MSLVEGIRGPDALRWCGCCQEFPLQLVAQFYDEYDPDHTGPREPTEFSHIGPLCPVCEDMIKNGELDVGDTTRARVAPIGDGAQPVEAA